MHDGKPYFGFDPGSEGFVIVESGRMKSSDPGGNTEGPEPHEIGGGRRSLDRVATPVCCFCGVNPVGYFDSDPHVFNEWCGMCEIAPTEEVYRKYLERRTARLVQARVSSPLSEE